MKLSRSLLPLPGLTASLFTACHSPAPAPAPASASLPKPPPAQSSHPSGSRATLHQRIHAALGRNFFQTAACSAQGFATVYGRKVTLTPGSQKIRATGPFVALIHGPNPGSHITVLWSSTPDSTLELTPEGEDPVIDMRGGSCLHSLDADETRPWLSLIKSAGHHP